MDYLTAPQISEWEAMERLDPMEPMKEDIRLAYLVATITNLAVGIHGKDNTKMRPITDFLLQWDPDSVPEKKQSPEDMLKIFQAIAMDQKAAMERKKKLEERKAKKAQEIKDNKEKNKKK